MDAELKDTICGKQDNTENSATTANQAQALIGNHSSAMNSIQNQRLNNQSSSDKLSQLINMSLDFDSGCTGNNRTDENQEDSNVINQQSETTSVNRRYNFNNRDMELSLAGSDDEDEEEDEDDEDDQIDEEVMHQQEQQHHDGDYGDIQFFHHKLLLQQHLGHNDFGIGSSVSSFGSPNGLVNIRGGGGSGGVDSFHIEECDDNGIGNSFSENPFVFPDNVMEYGEPQFFPGNCVGYLETILEETDEEFEEEEGCSGRHWWTADSDTDTDSVVCKADSVIRVDNGQKHQQNQFNNPNHSTVHSTSASTSSGGASTNLKAVDNMEDLSVQSTFRSSASSRPFELEDLHLLDQLDLAFEETLNQPRRRSGFAAFGHQLHLLDQPLESNKQVRGNNLQPSPFGLLDDDKLSSGVRSTVLQRSTSLDDDRSSKVFTQENLETHAKNEAQVISYGEEVKNDETKKLGNAESKETFGSSLSPSSSDSEPHEVAEEDFFYSSPGSESEEGSSSDDSEKNGDGGVVLAEFSLSQGGGLSNNNSGMLFGSARNRRSFESPLSSAKLKSFRSFDSLNSLSGTELLFSKADTFPSFHYIKEDVEPGSSGSGSPSSPRCNLNLSSSSTNDVPGATGTGRETSGGGSSVDRDCCGECEDESQSLPSHPSIGFPPTFNKITKKNSYSSSSTSTTSSCNSASGMMSTENLSEDSGIGIGPDGGTITTHHSVLIGKQSSESFSDEGPDHHHHPQNYQTQNQQDGESAKDFIAKTEFALNPMVFSSLSSTDTNSNSPSMNSIPSLNNQDSPSSDLTPDPENPDLFGETKGKVDYYHDKINPSIYPYGVLNNDTTISHNSLSNSHLSKVDEESVSLHTVAECQENHSEKNDHEDDSNQIPDNPLGQKCPISINNDSTTATIASINDDPPPIAMVKECDLHPHPNSQIQTKPSISSPDKADKAKTPGKDNNKSLDNIRDNQKPNNPAVVASMDPLGEKTNTIYTNVPLHSSSQLPSTLALTSKAKKTHCDCEPQNQQISPEIASISYSKPDLVLVETNTNINTECLPKAMELDSHASIVNTNVNEDTSIVILSAVESQNQNEIQHPHDGVGVRVSSGVPYIEENEIQEGTDHNILSKDKDVWNVNATHRHERQLSSSPSPPPSPSLISSASQGLEFEEDPDPSGYGHMANVSTGDGYQYPYQLDQPYRRERSNSESEFESAESAVEEDSIALAYAIVNSPTKGSASSSPTQELNGTNVNNLDTNVDSNRESGPVSTLMGLAMACEDYGKGDGMQYQERVMETCEVFASPSDSCVDDTIDNALNAGRSCSSSDTGQDGQNIFNVHTNNENYPTAELLGGIKNASHFLHHQHQENEVAEEPQEKSHSHYQTNPYSISSNSNSTTITYEVRQEPVGHELLASRSVTLDKSSSADVVHHIHKQAQEQPQQYNQQNYNSQSGVDKHRYHQTPHSHKHNQVDCSETIERDEDSSLVIAKPIDPVHIGVAEVKKFSQLDSSVSRNKTHSNHHHPYQTVGESESENSRPASSNNDIPSKASDQAILGHSNFGFFGRSSGVAGCVGGISRSSSVVKSPPPSIVNLDPKSSVGSGSLGSTTTTESSELSYGFPSPCPYPISETDLHAQKGQDWKEITSGANNSRRINRDQPKDQQRLHLEDIKCGIHPDNFTFPLGAYTAAVVAVAPSIPSKRLVFVNEGEQVIRIHEESSILKEKIATGSTSITSSNSLGNETSSINNKKFNPKPTNGSGNASYSPSVPDILVVKQTHLQGSEEGDKKEVKAYTNTQNNNTRTIRMEVDTSNTPIGGIDRRSTSPSGIPIKTRTYGARNEVEVVLVSSRTPSPSPVGGGGNGNFPQTSSLRQHKPSTSASLGEEGNNEEKENNGCPDPPAKVPRTRVHFSPVVSEISWRESYIDQSSEFSGSTEDLITKIGEVNQGDFIKSGATTIPTSHRDSGGYHPLNASNVSVTDSVVRPLHIASDQMSHYHASGEPVVRQPSPGSGKGPILVEKVQMRSSFLQGGDDEDEDDELERKLTMDIHIADNRQGCKSPVDEDYGDESTPIGDPHSRKENVEFRTGASSGSNRKVGVENGNGLLDLYEDVNVEIEAINKKSVSTTLPDLLSQCENANNAQTHIDVRIEEVGSTKPQSRTFKKSHSPIPYSQSEIPPPPTIGIEMHQHQQQQIFPKIFAEEGNGKSGKNDSKNNSSSSLNKTKKVSKVFSLGSSGNKKVVENPKDKDNKETNGSRETEASKENKSKANKPGFFERLSKIRLSGSKAKKQQRVHPKTDDLEQAKGGQPLRTVNAVNLNGNSTINGTNGAPTEPNAPGQVKKVQQTILKKAPANSPTPVLLNYSVNDVEDESEPTESHEAFENILDEIAGIKKIQMRMEKSNNGNSGTTSPDKPSPPVKELRSFAKRKQFYSESSSPSPPVSPNSRSYSDLDKKLTQFKEETSKTRDAVSKSHPDLELIEDSVRQHSTSPEPPRVIINEESNKSPESKKSPKKSSNSETGQKNEREWYKLLKSAAEKYYYRGSSKDDNKEKPSSTTSFKTGIVETDLDTGASREMLDAEIVELDRVPSYTVSTSEIPSSYSTPITTTAVSPGTAAKARSLTNLSTRLPLSIAPSNYNEDDPLAQGDHNDFDERARSYEFLLDDNQKSQSVPPENKLRFESRQLSEHELRIQRSLQRINVPEWFKNHETVSSRTCSPGNGSLSTTDKPANLKLLRRSEYGSSGGLAGGWAGLSAFKAPSMSSLQSSNGGRYSGSLNRSNFIRGRPATMSATRLSKESLAGAGSASHSPSAFDRCSFTYGMPFAMTRFSHGRMSNNSGSVTPTSTPDSSLLPTTSASYVKKPYLGWRSQERLNASGTGGPPKLSVYLPPEERLAAELLKTKITIRPPISDRPPLPKPPPRSEKTALSKIANNDNQRATSPSVSTTNNSSVAVVTKINQTNSIPPPNFSDDEQSSSACREKRSDIHESIREVTKAIGQYCQEEETPKPQPRKKSGKKSVWIESSFVGRKPVSK